MTARTIPTLATWTAGARVTGARLAAMVSYAQFWANPPSFRMTQQIAQSITTATWTQITCDTSDYDSDTGRGGSTPWSYTIPTGLSGRWQFGWEVTWANNGTGGRNSAIRKNGSAISGYTTNAPLAAGGVGGAGWTDPIAVVAGDVMSMWGWQNSGGSLSTSVATDAFPIFWGRLVSLGSP